MRIGIIGATGYTGQELIRLISNHPEAELAYCTSSSYAGMTVSEVLPHLSDVELTLEKYDAGRAKDCNVVFVALPHTKSMPVVRELFGDVRIIDLGGDFRLKDKNIYESWYKTEHEAPELLERSIYGLSELNKEQIKSAELIANPGCYATASALALLPLAKQQLIGQVIIDAKSGISGAGKEPSDKNLFGKIHENFLPYSVSEHKHQPEIDATLKGLYGNFGSVVFTPHLIPVDRGILCSIYCSINQHIDSNELNALYKDFYAGKPFVNILTGEKYPDIKTVRGTNRCDIALTTTGKGFVKIFSTIDNLIKGASGQAIQNMNIMFGLDEAAGLPLNGMAP